MTEPTAYESQSKTRFRRLAERFDHAYDEQSAYGRFLRARLTAVCELLGDGPGDLLDLGCGPGRVRRLSSCCEPQGSNRMQ